MEDPKSKVGKEQTETALMMILIVVGIIAIVTLVLALTSTGEKEVTDKIVVEGYQNQADEAVKVLEALKESMLDPDKLKDQQFINKLNSIQDGENLNSFCVPIGFLMSEFLNLKYYLTTDFVFYKGGGRFNNSLEFYVEAISSLKHSTDRQDDVNQDLCIRLYSDGTIERYDNAKN